MMFLPIVRVASLVLPVRLPLPLPHFRMDKCQVIRRSSRPALAASRGASSSSAVAVPSPSHLQGQRPALAASKGLLQGQGQVTRRSSHPGSSCPALAASSSASIFVSPNSVALQEQPASHVLSSPISSRILLLPSCNQASPDEVGERQAQQQQRQQDENDNLDDMDPIAGDADDETFAASGTSNAGTADNSHNVQNDLVHYPGIVAFNNQDWPVIVPPFVDSEQEVVERFDSIMNFDMTV